MPTTITKNPKIALNRFVRELLYGFIAFLIAYLFDLGFDFLTVNDYSWLIPLLDALEHGVMKALDEFDIVKNEQFEPFYKEVVEKIKKIIQEKTTSPDPQPQQS